MMKFIPTPEMKLAVRAILTSKIFADGIRPIVKENQEKVLAENDFRFSQAWRDQCAARGVSLPEFVREERLAYLMEEEELKIYLQKVYELNIAAGLTVQDVAFCPLLVAESMYRDSVRLLLEVMEPITGLPVVRIPWNRTEKLVQLMLELIVPSMEARELAVV